MKRPTKRKTAPRKPAATPELRARFALAALPLLLQDHRLGEDHIELIGVEAYAVADSCLDAGKQTPTELRDALRRLRVLLHGDGR